jgi:predicted RNA-binding Zn ribbon-like protein
VRINKTLDKINAPGGLLQVTGKAVAKADNVLGHTDILIANEQTSLDQWNRQISATLDNVNLAVAATTANENEITKSSVETLNATTATVNALKPVMDNLVIDEQALNTATVGITAMLPDIQATAVNVKGMTADGHETTTMTKEWLHGILHPTWATRVKNAMLDVLQHLPVP